MVVKALMLAAALAAAGDPADWERNGRPLPARESRLPSADPRLPLHAACHATPAGRVHGSVTTILPDLFGRWTRGFAALHPQAQISAAPPYGPPQGKLSSTLRNFLEGGSDFALVSRALSPEDNRAFRLAHGRDPLVIPVAAGSWRHFGFVDTVVVIVNAANPARQMTFAQLDSVFSSSRLRRNRATADWGDLGAPGWKGRAIRPVGGAGWLREDSARSSVVRDRVLLGGTWSPALAAGGDEASSPDRVARDPQAIAITGLGHLPPGTRALAISSGAPAPFIFPSYRDVAAGRYPLSRTVDMIVRQRSDGSIDPVLAEYLRFVLSREGQKIVAAQGVFLPLRADQARASLALIGACPKTSPAR